MSQGQTTKRLSFALHIKNWSLPGAQRFLKATQSVAVLEQAAQFVLSTLFNDKNPPPDIRSITIAITSHGAMKTMGAAAFQSASDLDDAHRVIEISEAWLAQIATERFQDELLGVLRHEMVHCFQPVNHDKTPQGLIEGLADWVRLRSDLAPPHWKPDTSSRWDAGYETTAYFLEFLERAYGEGTVASINSRACSQNYSASDWKGLLGNDVGQLWSEFCVGGTP